MEAMMLVAERWGDGGGKSGSNPPPNQVDSSLASQLKNVLLQNEGNITVNDQQNAAELALPSYEFDQGFGAAWSFLEPEMMQLESAYGSKEVEEIDPLKDPVLNYISDMMMVDEEGDRTCMFIECSAYQAMAEELNGLISEPSTPSVFGENIHGSEDMLDGKNVDYWIDGLLNPDGNLDSCSSTINPPASSLAANGLASNVPSMNSPYILQEAGNMGSTLNSPKEHLDIKNLQTTSYMRHDNEMNVNSVEELLGFLQGSPTKPALSIQNKEETKVLPTQQHRKSFSCSCAEFACQGAEPSQQSLPNKPIEVSENQKILKNKERLELHNMLVECAQAIAADDITKAYKVVNLIRDRVHPNGDGCQRLAYYFAEALVARITGTGGLLYTAALDSKPPITEILKAYHEFTKHLPNVRISHFFSTQTILDASEGAQRVHIVDYGILYGFAWPCLIKALALRPGGPPNLRITGIDFPQPGFKPAERVEETGRRLAEFAKSWNVPFEFHAVATKWETIQPSSLFLRHDEVLIVNCSFRLRHLLDESVMAESPRKLVLSRIRSMKPKVFVQAVVNGNYNAPFFMTRFRDALGYYGAVFDGIHASFLAENTERHLIEQQMFGRDILNIVACEGTERVERAESYKQWQSRTQRAGFEQIPLSPEIYNKAKKMLSSYHKDFGIGQDGKWLLLGWKDRVMHAMCTWRPRR